MRGDYPPRLRVEDLSVEYPEFRLGPLTFTLGKGLHAILGPNGAGKTTLLRAIAGLLPRRGRVLLGDIELRGGAWRFISSNLAEPPIGFNATVADYARLYVGRVSRDWRERTEAVFSKLGVRQMLGRSFEELSAGQRSLALSLIAIARPSPLLLLDEPFAHLDPYWRCRLLELLQRESSRRIVVYTTHEFDTPRYTDTLILIRDGIIVAEGRPEEILVAENLERLYGTGFVVKEGCVTVKCAGADERRAIHRGL